MINKTMGPGGDYADINLALQSILTNTEPADDMIFTQISDITDTHVSLTGYGSCFLNRRNISFLNPNRYKTYLNHANNGGFFFLFAFAVSNTPPLGQVIIDGFDITDISGQTESNPMIYLRHQSVYDGGKIIFRNNKLNGNDLANYGLMFYVQTSGAPLQRYDIYNNRIGGIIPTTGSRAFYCYFNGSADASDKIYIENNAIVRPPNGYGIYFTPQNIKVNFKNNVVINSGSPGLGHDWYALPANCDVKNCADSDDTLVSGSGNVHGVVPADFFSVDPASDNFLKILVGSKLRDVGTTVISAWNTTDFGGRLRPNHRGLCCIGAHEPISADTTLLAKINGENYQVTKRIDL